MFGIAQRRATYLIAAAVLLLAGVAAVIAAQAQYSFLAPANTGGSILVLQMADEAADEESLRSFFADQAFGPTVVQRLGSPDEHAFQVRTTVALPDDVETWLGLLEGELGAVDQDTLAVQTAQTAPPNLASTGVPALLAAVAVTLAVAWWPVRGLPGSLRYPAAALAALLHAVGLAFGLHVLMTLVVGWVDATSLFVALPIAAALALQAILTMLGRVRYNVTKYRGDSYNSVLVRSTAESIHTVIVTLICILILGVGLLATAGPAVAGLAATVLFGAVGAAYSSLFVFVPLLVGPETRLAGAAPGTTARRRQGRGVKKGGAATQRRPDGARRTERRESAKSSGRMRWLWIIAVAVAVVCIVWIAMSASNPSKSYVAVFETEKGSFVVELYADKVPNTVDNFIGLARDGFYDNTTFHRVLPGFMAQAGDPTGTGAGGPGYVINDEFHPDLKHDQAGVVSMANRGADTGSSQFFITYEATPWLDAYDENGQLRDCHSSQVSCHAVFGRVIEGMDVVESLTPRDPGENPDYDGDLIITIRIEER